MSKIFDWIGDLFTKIWKIFKQILPYIMIALAVYFTFGGSLKLLGMVLEGYEAAIACMGISFLVAPEETIDTVTDVAEAIGTAAGAVVSGVAGGVAAGLFGGDNTWMLIAAIAVGTYFLISGDANANDRVSVPANTGPGRNENGDVAVGSTATASNKLRGVLV